jgi:hypothetical protein
MVSGQRVEEKVTRFQGAKLDIGKRTLEVHIAPMGDWFLRLSATNEIGRRSNGRWQRKNLLFQSTRIESPLMIEVVD